MFKWLILRSNTLSGCTAVDKISKIKTWTGKYDAAEISSHIKSHIQSPLKFQTIFFCTVDNIVISHSFYEHPRICNTTAEPCLLPISQSRSSEMAGADVIAHRLRRNQRSWDFGVLFLLPSTYFARELPSAHPIARYSILIESKLKSSCIGSCVAFYWQVKTLQKVFGFSAISLKTFEVIEKSFWYTWRVAVTKHVSEF